MNLESEGSRGPGSGRKKLKSYRSKNSLASRGSRSSRSNGSSRSETKSLSIKRSSSRQVLGARKLFALYKSKSINYPELQEAMELRQNCFRKIKDEQFFVADDDQTSSAQGFVYKTCGHVVSNCLECDDPLAVKIFLRRSRLSPEPLQEARVLLQITDSFLQDKEFGPMYSRHIIKYVDYIKESIDNPNFLVTQLVEFSPGRALNLSEFLRSGNCTVTILESLLIQIFLTLEYINTRVPGFVHFDFLPQQIFLRNTKKLIVLKTPNSTFKLKTTIEAVIGDFGFSISDKYPNNHEPIIRDFQLRVIGFDVFRLLTDCSYLVGPVDRQLHHRMQQWIAYAFKNKVERIDALRDEWVHRKRLKDRHFKSYGYLPQSAGPFLRGTPLEFLKKIPFVNHYYSRNKT